jgi:regulator of protease activity HflC (stomatin/prohibitin superfamily)
VIYVVLIVIVVLAVILLAASVRVAAEYERGVVFRFGRLIDLKGPGLFLIIPFGVDRLVKVDLRVITLEVPPQEVITHDNVTIKVNAVIYFQVVDARAAVTRVLNFVNSTSQFAQTTLRAVLGQSSLDELLARRDKINQDLQRIIDEQTEPWGIKVSVVEIKDVELPQTMQRAMAKQAEAEREKRAKIINADGEFQAAQTLANAAQVIGTQPATLQLRYLQTLIEVGQEKNTVIVFPIPLELITPFLQSARTGSGPDGSPEAVREPVAPEGSPAAPESATTA